MNVLILGKGFLGQKLYRHLKDNADKLSQPHQAPGEVVILSRAELDYTDYHVLWRYLRKMNYSWVINASGYTGVPNIDAAEYDKATCWKMNVEVPNTIMAAADRAEAFVVHISSGCIFNGYEKHWTEEDTPNFGVFNPHSSFYSKTKHAAETLISDRDAIILRLRMPFCGEPSSRNYFTKLLSYDNLISTPNSVTCVEDLCEAVLDLCERWVGGGDVYGIYHIVNEGTLTAKQVIECLAKYGLTNPNHRFIELSELQTKAPRSNCILSTEITRGKLTPLPNALESLEKCVKRYAAQHIATQIDYEI